MTRKAFFILLTVVLVAAVVFGYVFFKDRLGFLGQNQIRGLDVALRTAKFLDTTFQSDGSMLAGFGCLPDTDFKQCDPLEVESSVNIPVNQLHLGQAIYGYYILAKETGDQSYRAKADLAMDFVLEHCQTNIEMCAWNFFPMSRYYFDTREDKYLQGMLRPAQQFIYSSDLSLVNQNAGHKLASLYKATKDEVYKKRLLELADSELSKWSQEPSRFGYSIQVIWSVLLPAYDITKDKKYLGASEEFFNNFDIAQNFDKLKTIDSAIRGADALLSLSEITDNGEVYKTRARAVLQETMNQLWDNPQNQKANGDYGFTEIQGGKFKFKKTLTNGWLIKLFILMSDEKFNLPIKQNE